MSVYDVLTITGDDARYPAGLTGLADAPETLYAIGNPAALTMPAVTVTGARASTSYGYHVAAQLACGLARTHAVVTGGAYGIDAAAIRHTLAAGGVPVVYLASGLYRMYPTGNAELLYRVADAGGVVISESVGDRLPTRARFLERVRLLAAHSAGTVIVEASPRSGALAVAARAAGYGRPVGAVPGPITSGSSAGCHKLIREGAALVTDAADVLAMIGGAS